MPTNEERREVAARLRKNEPSSFGSLFDVWREIALAVNPSGGSYKTLPLELADLIEPEPERTCRDLGGEYGTNCEAYDFGCSECGFGCDIPQPNYCPHCGAKVVE